MSEWHYCRAVFNGERDEWMPSGIDYEGHCRNLLDLQKIILPHVTVVLELGYRGPCGIETFAVIDAEKAAETLSFHKRCEWEGRLVASASPN